MEIQKGVRSLGWQRSPPKFPFHSLHLQMSALPPLFLFRCTCTSCIERMHLSTGQKCANFPLPVWIPLKTAKVNTNKNNVLLPVRGRKLEKGLRSIAKGFRLLRLQKECSLAASVSDGETRPLGLDVDPSSTVKGLVFSTQCWAIMLFGNF